MTIGDRVLGWLDEQTRVEVMPDLGAGWAAVLVAPLFPSAGLPPFARLQVVAAHGTAWEPTGLDRVIGRPARSPDGQLLAGWALRGEGIGRFEAHLWVLAPGDASAQVRWVDCVPVGWQSTGTFPVLVEWVGDEVLVAGAPGQISAAEAAALAVAQVFEDVPGSRVRVDPVQEQLISLWLIRADGGGGRRTVGLAPRNYRQIRASPDGRFLAAHDFPAPDGGGVVMVADLQADRPANTSDREDAVGVVAAQGLARMGWLADGRLVGVLPDPANDGGAMVATLWPGRDRRHDAVDGHIGHSGVIAAGVAFPVMLSAEQHDLPWWLPSQDGRLLRIDAAGAPTWAVAGGRDDGGPWAELVEVIDAGISRLVTIQHGVGQGGSVLSLLATQERPEDQGGQLEVLHRVRLGAGRMWLRANAGDGGTVVTVDRRGQLAKAKPGTAGTAVSRKSDRIRMVDLGDPVGDGSMRVALHAPARKIRACVVTIHPSFGGGPPESVASAPPRTFGAPQSLGPSDPTRLLVTFGYAVVMVSTTVPWWPQVPDELIRPDVADRITAAVIATKLSEHVDIGRLAVAGNSFGASLALIALADTSLFRTAIVSSGGYCRALTPLGFQDEYRTLWQAPAVYRDFDAVLSAPRITRPVLIVHGLADHHPATPPEQSHLLYQALVGLGVPARLVLIPGDGHSLRTREGITAYTTERVAWLDRWTS